MQLSCSPSSGDSELARLPPPSVPTSVATADDPVAVVVFATTATAEASKVSFPIVALQSHPTNAVGSKSVTPTKLVR